MSTTATNLRYQSSKTYTHSTGLSCCFRQWRAKSHCNKLHGYALKVELVFEDELDERNWVQDFGDLKPVKAFLERTFDHKTIIAEDDPHLDQFEKLHRFNLIDLVMLPGVGCEKFAEYIFTAIDNSTDIGHKLQSVQVWEHEGNSAKVIRHE